jgi:hypothetical protein
MKAIVVKSPWEAQFASTSETVEVRNEAGALLGFFAPASLSGAALRARMYADYDAEEIKRRKQETDGSVTTAELLAQLAALEEKLG